MASSSGVTLGKATKVIEVNGKYKYILYGTIYIYKIMSLLFKACYNMRVLNCKSLLEIAILQ